MSQADRRFRAVSGPGSLCGHFGTQKSSELALIFSPCFQAYHFFEIPRHDNTKELINLGILNYETHSTVCASRVSTRGGLSKKHGSTWAARLCWS